MAIVEMKRLSLLALKKDRDGLLEAMQRLGCVQVTEVTADAAGFSGGEAAEALSGEIARLEAALEVLRRHDTDPKPLFGVMPQVGEDEARRVLESRDEVAAAVSRLEGEEARLGELRGAEARALAALEALRPWEGLDAAPGAWDGLKTVSLFIGRVPARSLEAVKAALGAFPVPAQLEVLSLSGDSACVAAVAHSSCRAEASAALEAAGFEEERFADWGTAVPRELIVQKEAELAAVEEERAAIARSREGAAGEIRRMKILRDALAVRRDRQIAAERCASTARAFLLQGWVPARSADKLCGKLREISPTCAAEAAEPAEGETPPVLLRNGRFATPFESVVEGFALPAYEGIDPTPVMAPFYACLFGMMVSDAGYGLVMSLALLLFMKVKKIRMRNAKLLMLLVFGGVLTLLWGAVYNSFFGFALLPERYWLLDPVKKPLLVMGICIGTGALHLFTGLGLAAFRNISRGDPVAAVSDQLSWLLLVVGLVMLAVPPMAGAGSVLALLGAGTILLMKGRANKNPLKRLLSGLGALYGISGWLGDLLSYIRLFGMGLATGVIAMVFNRLIAMVWEAGIIGKILGAALFVACHAFNLGVNALGAYVHACRLQYIEFFGKFYEEGGSAFRPLEARGRYVRIGGAGEAP